MGQVELPAGTVTFLFTDVEGSTRLLEELGAEQYAAVLAEHHRVCRDVWSAHGGVEVDTAGDAFFVAFARPSDALGAAAAAQAELVSGPLRVRMGVHSGEVMLGETGYVGMEVHRAARIAAAGHGGQVLVSSTTAALVEMDALRDLGEHRFKDLAAAERVYQLGEFEFPALKSLYRSNLPVQATPFLGREGELAEVVELLGRRDVGLLTLTGPGGTGKTRLALQAAAEVAGEYPDGVLWVPLAALQDPVLVVSSVAQVCAVREEPGRELVESLAARLGGKRVLLLLDNVEHLLPAAAVTVALLRDLGGPTLLVTSRERMALAGEHSWPVPTLGEHDGVELFVMRARQVDPRFAETPAVAELCRRLDHLPLALELAAARVRVLTPDAMLHRLGDRLRLLTGGDRDRPERQQTLRAAIAWSYELLSGAEQTLFERLAVFRGGRTLDAIEAICADEATEPDLLDGVESLIDKNLLRREETPGSEPRFVMLETIHEFARERLADRAELEAVSRLHADYYLSLAEAVRPELDKADAASWLARLEHEHDNMRAALEFLASSGSLETELRLAVSLRRFWELRGHVSEGQRRLGEAVERLREDGAVAAEIREEAVRTLAVLTHYIGRTGDAVALFEEALAAAIERGDEERATRYQSEIALALGEAEEYTRSLAIFEQLIASGRLDGELRANVLLNSMMPLAAFGQLERARSHGEQALGLYCALGSRDGVGLATSNLGFVEVLLGEPVAAEGHFRDALAVSFELDWPRGIAYSLLGLAATRAHGGSGTDAARLAGASQRRLETIGATYETLERAAHDRITEKLRHTLGEDAFATTYAEGQALSVEEALALAGIEGAP